MNLFDRGDFSGSSTKVWFENGAKLSGKIRFSDVHSSIAVHHGTEEGQVWPNNPATMEVFLEDGVYRFPTTYYYKKDDLHFFTVPDPFAVEREQRREFVRVRIDTPARLYLSPVDPPLAVRVVDLSGGGLRLECPVMVEIGDTLELEFSMRGTLQFVRGTVVHIQDEIVGISFLEMKPADRDRVVGYVFWQQARNRRRGIEI